MFPYGVSTIIIQRFNHLKSKMYRGRSEECLLLAAQPTQQKAASTVKTSSRMALTQYSVHQCLKPTGVSEPSWCLGGCCVECNTNPLPILSTASLSKRSTLSKTSMLYAEDLGWIRCIAQVWKKNWRSLPKTKVSNKKDVFYDTYKLFSYTYIETPQRNSSFNEGGDAIALYLQQCWRPWCVLEMSHLWDMTPQTPVNAAALVTNQNSPVYGCPTRIWKRIHFLQPQKAAWLLIPECKMTLCFRTLYFSFSFTALRGNSSFCQWQKRLHGPRTLREEKVSSKTDCQSWHTAGGKRNSRSLPFWKTT